MKNEEAYIILIYKSLKGEITKQESNLLEVYTQESPENKAIRLEIEDTWLLSADLDLDYDVDLHIDVEGDLNAVNVKIDKQISTDTTQSNTSYKSTNLNTNTSEPINKSKTIALNSKVNWGRRLSLAATFLVLVSAGLFLFVNESNNLETYVAEGAPHSYTLPDGSTLKLNANSKVVLASDFGKDDRKVELEGEAYFDVAHEASKAFEITTSKATITVLGTSFTVKETPTQCQIMVRTGKVKVVSDTDTIILTKDRAANLIYATHKIQSIKMSSANIDYWETKKIVFRNQKLSEIITELELLYGINIDIEPSKLHDCALTLVSNQITKAAILEKISLSLNAQLDIIDNDNFLLKNGHCQ